MLIPGAPSLTRSGVLCRHISRPSGSGAQFSRACLQAAPFSRNLPAVSPFSRRSSRGRGRAVAKNCCHGCDAAGTTFNQPVAKDPTRWLLDDASHLVTVILRWMWKGALAIGVACALALAAPKHAEAGKSGGRMGGSAFSSRQSYSGSYSSSPNFVGGTSPLRSSPTVSINLGPTFGWGGYGFGYPVMFGGGSVLSLLLFAAAAFALVQILSNNVGLDEGGGYGNERVAVARVQVGLLGSARQLQRDLERIAKRADTNDVEGLQYILQETVLALNRNPDYWVYGASNLKNTRGPVAAEKKLNEWSLEERGKFREETLSNVGGRTKQQRLSGAAGGFNELIVVTVIAAVDGGMKLPRVTSREDLRTALNRLGAITLRDLMAVEVLWTPQDEADVYTQEELLAEYPSMYTL